MAHSLFLALDSLMPLGIGSENKNLNFEVVPPCHLGILKAALHLEQQYALSILVYYPENNCSYPGNVQDPWPYYESYHVLLLCCRRVHISNPVHYFPDIFHFRNSSQKILGVRESSVQMETMCNY